MKKRWTVVSLVILLFQYFSPLVAVAESLSNNSDSFAITQLSVNDGAVINSEEVSIKLKGTAATSNNMTRSIKLVGAVLDATTSGQVISDSEIIGNFSSTVTGVTVTLNPEVKGNFELKFKAKLLDGETSQQVVSATGDFQSVTSPITLANSATQDSSEDTVETATSVSSNLPESEESSEVAETEESTMKDSETEETETSESKAPAKAVAKREPQKGLNP